jgi:hypothetical protein
MVEGSASKDVMLTAVGGGVTVTVTTRLSLPPRPWQLSVKSIVALSAPVVWVPPAAATGAPFRLQAVAPVVLHASDAVLPATTEGGVAANAVMRAAAGGGGGALPPPPPPHAAIVHVSAAVQTKIFRIGCSLSTVDHAGSGVRRQRSALSDA